LQLHDMRTAETGCLCIPARLHVAKSGPCTQAEIVQLWAHTIAVSSTWRHQGADVPCAAEWIRRVGVSGKLRSANHRKRAARLHVPLFYLDAERWAAPSRRHHCKQMQRHKSAWCKRTG